LNDSGMLGTDGIPTALAALGFEGPVAQLVPQDIPDVGLTLTGFAQLVAELPRQSFWNGFQRLDPDHDGLMSRAEAESALRALDADVVSEDAKRVLDTFWPPGSSNPLDVRQAQKAFDQLARADVREVFQHRARRPADDEPMALDAMQLRGALRDLGIDIKSDRSRQILAAYDKGMDGKLQILGFNTLVATLPTAKFWLRVDPSGSLRTMRRRFLKMNNAGLLNAMRATHYLSGVLALLYFFKHTWDTLFCAGGFLSYSAVSNRALIPPLLLSNICALTGLFRVKWTGGGIAMQSRRAGMWPASVFVLWGSLNCFTEGASVSHIPSMRQLISVFNPLMIVLLVVNPLICIRQVWLAGATTAVEDSKTAGMYNKRWQNVAFRLMFPLANFFIILPTVRAMFNPSNAVGLVSAYPGIALVARHGMLLGIYLYLFGSLLATMLEYDLVNVVQTRNIMIVLVLANTIKPFVDMALGTPGLGRAVWLQVSLQDYSSLLAK